MSKSVLIIGATGLVGRAMVQEYYKNGYTVYANLSHPDLKDNLFPKDIHLVVNDLDHFYGLEKILTQVDTVIHCAAYVNFNPKYANKVLDKNISWTKHIVNLCLEHNKELIHLSSISKFNPKKGENVTEKSESGSSQPSSAYPDSKYFSELEVWRGIAEGLKAIILIPGIILGEPNGWETSSGMFWVRVNNNLKYYPTGSCGFVDVKDVAKSSRLLLEKKAFGESFILVEGNYKYQFVLSSIAEQIGKQPPTKPISKPLIQLLSFTSKLSSFLKFSFPVTEYELKSSAEPINYSNKKVKEITQMEFIPLPKTIEQISKIFLSTYKK